MGAHHKENDMRTIRRLEPEDPNHILLGCTVLHIGAIVGVDAKIDRGLGKMVGKITTLDQVYEFDAEYKAFAKAIFHIVEFWFSYGPGDEAPGYPLNLNVMMHPDD